MEVRERERHMKGGRERNNEGKIWREVKYVRERKGVNGEREGYEERAGDGEE